MPGHYGKSKMKSKKLKGKQNRLPAALKAKIIKKELIKFLLFFHYYLRTIKLNLHPKLAKRYIKKGEQFHD